MINKSIFFFAFLLFTGSSFVKANTAAYKVDEAVLDQLFENAEDVSSSLKMEFNELLLTKLPSSTIADDGSTQTIAGIVALGSWVMGIGWLVPIHRFILGTGGNDFKIFSLYCITISGCGFILLIDGIHLLLTDNDTKYINSPKFIMW